jgi:O-antigen/teichoic acid export membrane protein
VTHSPQAKANLLFSNALSVFLTRFFPSLAGTLVILYFSKNLDKELYGTYQNFWIQLNILYPIACFGIHVLVITYKPSVLIQLRQYISGRSFLFYAIWIVILSMVFAFLQYYSLHLPVAISFLFLFSYSLSFIFESVLIVFKSFKTLITVSILYSTAFLFFHWYILHHGYSLKRLFAYLLIISVLRLIIYFTVTLSLVDKQKNETKEKIAIQKVRSLWMHLGAYDIIQNLFNWIDKFIISLLLTASVSAIYFNGTQNIPFIPLLLSAAGSAVLLQLGASNEEDNTSHAILLMHQSSRLLSCIIFPVFFFLVFFRQELFSVLFSDRYAESVPVFLVTILILPLRAYSFTTILQNRHKGAIINLVSLGDLILACLLMYPMYNLMGLPGIALSFVVTTYLQAMVYLFFTSKILNVGVLSLIPLLNWLIKLIVFFTLFIAIHYMLAPYFTGLITLTLGGIICMVTILLSLRIELKSVKYHDKKA